MNDRLSNDIPEMSVEDFTSLMSDSYSVIINKGFSIKKFPSVMLWGPPGVGKSQAIKQIAENIEKSTSKKTCVTDVRLMLFNPIDLRGIPTSNADKTLSVWLRPQIFDMDSSEDIVNILFLDEISAAPQSVQAAAYQITLDRVIGEHKLPQNCIVIAAGNRVTDKSVAFKMPKALANRLMHIEITESFDSWKSWALSNGIHDKVIGFLSFRRDYLMMNNTSNDTIAFATPRTWEMVSNILNTVSNDADTVYPLIAGLTGSGVATEFCRYCSMYSCLPDIEDIFSGKNPPLPQSPDLLYALCTAMTSYAREHKSNMTKISNSISYASAMPPEFSAMLIRDYMALDDDFRAKLMHIPEFVSWYGEKGRLFNGNF